MFLKKLYEASHKTLLKDILKVPYKEMMCPGMSEHTDRLTDTQTRTYLYVYLYIPSQSYKLIQNRI